MPIYEYVCKRCDDAFDALVRMDDRLVQPCPECGEASDMKISAPTIGLDPISGDFPGATSKWERNRKQKMAQEAKNSE